MLAILVTHPIQYHVPLWQLLARERGVPFEVWYLSEHATRRSRDREFQQDFAWDLEMLKGYPYRFIKTPSGASPNTPWRMRIHESLPDLLAKGKVKALWVQGWQVPAYWQAVWAAHKAGVEVWLRGESNILKQRAGSSGLASPRRVRPVADTASSSKGEHGALGYAKARQGIKRILLRQLFKRVDHFLCIGTANRELYRSYGVPESKLHMTPYAVDNERFAAQAAAIRGRRSDIRRRWKIPEDAFVVLFCGKFIPKKQPMDLIKAGQLLLQADPQINVHLLFVGSGELGPQMRSDCNVVFDADASKRSDDSGQKSQAVVLTSELRPLTSGTKPPASFAGFLNQTEISKAYVAADVLALPSDYGETWGLVVNEAMSSGLPCIISDHCGCAPDLGGLGANRTFPYRGIPVLASQIAAAGDDRSVEPTSSLPSLRETVDMVTLLYEHAVSLNKA